MRQVRTPIPQAGDPNSPQGPPAFAHGWVRFRRDAPAGRIHL